MLRAQLTPLWWLALAVIVMVLAVSIGGHLLLECIR
jgi:hypothetical protein